jgi:hypothetical protein
LPAGSSTADLAACSDGSTGRCRMTTYKACQRSQHALLCYIHLMELLLAHTGHASHRQPPSHHCHLAVPLGACAPCQARLDLNSQQQSAAAIAETVNHTKHDEGVNPAQVSRSGTEQTT